MKEGGTGRENGSGKRRELRETFFAMISSLESGIVVNMQ